MSSEVWLSAPLVLLSRSALLAGQPTVLPACVPALSLAGAVPCCDDAPPTAP